MALTLAPAGLAAGDDARAATAAAADVAERQHAWVQAACAVQLDAAGNVLTGIPQLLAAAVERLVEAAAVEDAVAPRPLTPTRLHGCRPPGVGGSGLPGLAFHVSCPGYAGFVGCGARVRARAARGRWLPLLSVHPNNMPTFATSPALPPCFPAGISLDAYAARLLKYCKCSPVCFTAAFAYMARLQVCLGCSMWSGSPGYSKAQLCGCVQGWSAPLMCCTHAFARPQALLRLNSLPAPRSSCSAAAATRAAARCAWTH